MRKFLFSVYCVGLALVFMLFRAPACSGVHVEPPPRAPGPGEVALVEVMADPASGRPEWIELANRGEARLDLAGCMLSDGGTSEHLVYLPPATYLEPGGLCLVTEEKLDAVAGAVVLMGDAPLVLAEDDPDEVIRLHCPGTDGALVLIDDLLLGPLDPAPRGHSWMLERSLGGAQDDDPARWCVAGLEVPYGAEPEYGTPGQPNSCPAPAGERPRPGELRITEIMVAPYVGREWFELSSSAGVTLDLAGCVLTEGGAGTTNEHVLDPARGSTAVAPGEMLLLAAGELELVPGGIEADYAYSALTFNNNVREELSLHCGEDEIERVAYDWAAVDGERGQSLARDPDDPEYWCLAEEPFYEGEDGTEYGSPASPNPPCADGPPPGTWPAPGEVVITELMIAPSNGTLFPEWFEVVNLSGHALELDGCRVEDDGHIADLTADAPLAPGFPAVIARGGFDPGCDLVPHGTYGGSVAFNNSVADRCALVCPGGDGWVTIDEVWFDWPAWGLDKGWALGLDAGATDAEANDDPARWCPAPDHGWSCTVQGYTDHGSPGLLEACP